MKEWLQSHPEARSGLRVAVYTFIAQFALSLVGFLSKVAGWATSAEAIDFPAVEPLGKAAVAAFVAALSGLIGFAYNKLPMTTTARYPKEPQPNPEVKPDRGESQLVTVLIVLGCIFLAILIVRAL